MLSQSTFEFSYPSTASRARSFAGGDLESVYGKASPFTPLAQHLLSKGQYLDFLTPSVKDDSDLDVLFLTAHETVITNFLPATDDLSLNGSLLLNNWAFLEDELGPSTPSPTISSSLNPVTSASNVVDPIKSASQKKATVLPLDSGSVLKPMQPSLSKGTQSLPSSNATKASCVKNSTAPSVEPVATFTDLPSRLNGQFGRAEDALKATIARLQAARTIKQVDPAPQACVRLADVNAYGDISVIPTAVDSATRNQEDCLKAKSVNAPLPSAGPVSPSLLPSPSSSGSTKPLNKRKAPALPAKPNPRKRSKVDDDDDFVDRPAPKKRRAPAAKKALTTRRAPSSWSGRRFPCTLCDQWCKRAGDLAHHMKRRDHAGVEEECPYPGCSQTFTRKDSAKRHLLNEHDVVLEAEEAM